MDHLYVHMDIHKQSSVFEKPPTKSTCEPDHGPPTAGNKPYELRKPFEARVNGAEKHGQLGPWGEIIIPLSFRAEWQLPAQCLPHPAGLKHILRVSWSLERSWVLHTCLHTTFTLVPDVPGNITPMLGALSRPQQLRGKAENPVLHRSSNMELASCGRGWASMSNGQTT